MSHTPHLDRLAAALCDGPTRLDNFSFTPGTDLTATAEQRAAEIYASMERTGLIVDGQVQVPDQAHPTPSTVAG